MKVAYATDGKPGKLAEYKDVNSSNRSSITTLHKSYSSKVRADVSLVHASSGYEPAGSVARWTDGYYAVRWTDCTGSIQGRRYRLDNMESAADHFYDLTRSDMGKFAWQK